MPTALTPAALGFRSHSGWAAVVCLAGPIDSPGVVERSRLLLTSGPLPCEPYHRAKGYTLNDAGEIVAAAATQARTMASEGISGLVASLSARGYSVSVAAVLLGRGRPDFTLTQALSTHAAMHNAEGWLHREALIQASHDNGLRVRGILEQILYSDLRATVGAYAPEIESRIRELGHFMGPPWAADQKLACAAAWLALADPLALA